ncbi:MBL fold metallo-hydrolase [Porphyromonas sp.]|uniref:MBL fold metallo-hydrolase n=1 Tax=Porphyromonas sp. TaxID=1924944 RepID=UPI0026DC1314|nr:MBL fold metallo-hydrolase [Porphyromonas sp.]MDO4695338.1 MBL fold metallo-hydrolase [Porphyromonas sp.]MDO4771098.1 MBL fold metallo-hydrolase [Porphyromonas sp.]
MAQLTFLGTGTSTGIPEIGCTCDTCMSTDPRDSRLRVSALISEGEDSVLIDCGPDFREQLLKAKVDRLNAILITHEHYDHVGGLDDIRPLFRKQSACHVYAEPNVIQAVKTRMPYAFAENKYPGVPDIDLTSIAPFEPLRLTERITVEPLRVIHGKLPILGFKVGDLAYITDCKTLPEETLQKIKGIDTLIINTLRLYPHISHLCLDETLDYIQQIDPRRTYLIHFAHTFGRHEEIERILPDCVFPAYDGLTISFNI